MITFEIGSATAKGGFANEKIICKRFNNWEKDKQAQNTLKYKQCYCPDAYWEVIVVDNDENFDGGTTVYYHCDYCGEDFVILDLETSEILFKKDGG